MVMINLTKKGKRMKDKHEAHETTNKVEERATKNAIGKENFH